MCLIQCLIFNAHLYLSGVWLGVNLKVDNEKTCVAKRLDYKVTQVLLMLKLSYTKGGVGRLEINFFGWAKLTLHRPIQGLGHLIFMCIPYFKS